MSHNQLNVRAVSRDANLDLLRITATLFVIILHYNNAGSGKAFLYTAELGYQFHVLLLLEAFSICAVNLFVLITGYYQCSATQVSLEKPFVLASELIILSVLRYVANCVLGFDSFSLRALIQSVIPTNWYLAIYIALYLTSPYINIALKQLSLPQHKTMLVVLFCLFSLWGALPNVLSDFTGFDAASPISAQGSADGYTLVNFVFLYASGAYFRKIKQNTAGKCLLLSSGVTYLASTVGIFLYSRMAFGTALSYCNPFVIIQSIALFVFFCNLEIKCSMISKFAKYSFGVYLLHSFFYPFISIEAQVTGSIFLIPIYVFFSSVAIYLIASLVYFVYRVTLNKLIIHLSKMLRHVTYGV